MTSRDWTIAGSCWLLALIVANYIAWLVNSGDTLRSLILLLIFVALGVVIWERVRAKDFFLICVLGLLLLLTVRSPLVAWDARSIWFFHAKRMFYDGALSARLDNYGNFSHNDYPDLVPSLAASITRAVHLWNEVLPKLAIFFVLVPAVTILLRLFQAEVSRFILVIILIRPVRIAHDLLVNGVMDGILGVYMAVLLLCSCSFLVRWPQGSKPSWAEQLACPLLLAVLCGLKNEGTVIGLLYLVLFAAVLLYGKFPRAIIARFLVESVLAFLPIMIWKIRLIPAHINNDLVEHRGGAVARAMTRLNAHDLKSIILATWFPLIAALMIVISLSVRDKLAAKWFALSLVAIYYLILFGIYLSTPLDLTFHLMTSARRVSYPLVLTLIVFCLWCWDEQHHSKKRLEESTV
jgi:hypothetical protein